MQMIGNSLQRTFFQNSFKAGSVKDGLRSRSCMFLKTIQIYSMQENILKESEILVEQLFDNRFHNQLVFDTSTLLFQTSLFYFKRVYAFNSNESSLYLFKKEIECGKDNLDTQLDFQVAESDDQNQKNTLFSIEFGKWKVEHSDEESFLGA